MSELCEQWTDKISAWCKSGLSMAAWCRENNESYYRFIYWRRKLEPAPAPESPSGGRFVELTWQQSPLSLTYNGITLQIESGFDPALLRDVLTVLKTV